jgi:hypothetical protein
MQDLGVGISHYFELLRTMAGLFVIMFLFGIPSLIITFTANPDAVSDAIKAGGPLGVLRYRCGLHLREEEISSLEGDGGKYAYYIIPDVCVHTIAG